MSRRLQFSLRTLLIGLTSVAILTFLFALPTYRVNRFAHLIETGKVDQAVAMLDRSIGEGDGYRSMLEHVCSIPPERKVNLQTIRIEPLTFTQLIQGKRRIVVGQGWGGGDVEFIVTRQTISKGQNWLHVL